MTISKCSSYINHYIKGVCAILILTRRVGETLIIGNDVTVTVLGVKGHQVRLGIDAPKDVSVHREEIYQRIQQEKAKAVQVGAEGEEAAVMLIQIETEEGL